MPELISDKPSAWLIFLYSGIAPFTVFSQSMPVQFINFGVCKNVYMGFEAEVDFKEVEDKFNYLWAITTSTSLDCLLLRISSKVNGSVMSETALTKNKLTIETKRTKRSSLKRHQFF